MSRIVPSSPIPFSQVLAEELVTIDGTAPVDASTPLSESEVYAAIHQRKTLSALCLSGGGIWPGKSLTLTPRPASSSCRAAYRSCKDGVARRRS